MRRRHHTFHPLYYNNFVVINFFIIFVGIMDI